MNPEANFRPVYPPNVHVNNTNISIYRGANPDNWSEDDLQKLAHHYRVKTIIDFRFPFEMKFKPKLGLWKNYFAEQIHNSVLKTCKPIRSGGKATRYMVGMLGIHFYVLLILMMKIQHIFVLIYYLLLALMKKDKFYQTYAVQKSFGNKSLVDLYMLLVDACQPTLREIFLLLRYSDQFPVMITCQQGKDRTGVVSMLIQDLMQCDDEQIEENFALSELAYTDDDSRVAVVGMFAAMGMSHNFIGSDKIIMQKFLLQFREKYISAECFLLRIGLTSHDINQIKHNISNYKVCNINTG